MMERYDDWPEKLAAFIETRRERVFSWGSQDCALFAADAVIEMTGVDLAKELRGYRSARGAANRIKKAGGMRSFASSLSEKHPGLAQRGDVVLVDIDGRETFGVVLGNGFWCGPGIEGLVFRPMNEVEIVFGV
ncbi:hypothetical protein L1889_03865 [Paenalcaligenes niemegkensis]|uniref:DUF6950 family protein n=1 Tax=Paenalcaligenes niemegkensis TaxID=2895469 RepID=UPI001EE7CDBC|nr:hypothetical protein [Paenalcaligenes niemegkensis]MCQ9615946.1 hypothetical protein [Paenalcaligenes niemegkensis]